MDTKTSVASATAGNPAETKLRDSIFEHLHYNFKNINLFVQATTHKSWVNENPKSGETETKDYQRLEFLGDSVLKLIQSTIIHSSNPTWTEGQMTELRASYENNKNLSLWAQKLNLHQFIKHGLGVAPSGLLYAQVFEAVIGAIWIDCGYDFTKMCDIYAGWKLQPTVAEDKITNYKKDLQELLQDDKYGYEPPEYRLIEKTGPNHKPTFTVTCTCEVIADDTPVKIVKTAKATSIKQAEKDAASQVLIELKKLNINKAKKTKK